MKEVMAESAGAGTPEELETLFEDALLLRDAEALAALFDAGAVLSTGDGQVARGRSSIARAALARWQGTRSYVAQPRRAVQARDIALIVAEESINVARRAGDGAWRYAVMHPGIDEERERVARMAHETSLAPALVVAEDQGEARWWFNALAIIKATAADTGGHLTVVEMREPAGSAAPLHVHHREDESFWIIEGSATFEVGDAVVEARAGDFVFGPRDIPHRYTVGESGCRMLFIMTPGGFEELVIAMSEPAATRTLPPPSVVEPDWERVASIARANGCELLA